MTAAKTIAVIGGGIAGLTTAYMLTKQTQCDVLLFEASSKTGGWLQSHSVDNRYVHEIGANGVIPTPHTIELLNHLEINLVPASASAKHRWIWIDDSLHVVPRGIRSLLCNDLLNKRTVFRMLLEPLFRKKPINHETIHTFLAYRFGNACAQRLIAPWVTGVFAGDSEQLEFEASFPLLFDIAQQGSLLLGMRKHKTKERLSAPQGGMGKITQHLTEQLGDRVKTNTEITQIHWDNMGNLTLNTHDNCIDPDVVVLAIPSYQAAPLLLQTDSTIAETMEEISHASLVVAYVSYRKEDVPEPIDGFGFLSTPKSSINILGVVYESILWDDRAPKDEIMFRCMLGGSNNPEIIDQDDDMIGKHVHQSLKTVLGITNPWVQFDCYRYPQAITQYSPGHLDRIALIENRLPDNICLAGSSWHGVSVNACIKDGMQMASRIVENHC